MKSKLSRRDILLAGGVATAAMFAGAGGWVALADPRQALLDFFKTALPGVKIDETSALECIDGFLGQWDWKKRRAASVAWAMLGVENMAEISEKFELAARRVFTSFLTNSNFFDVSDPLSVTIVYEQTPAGTPCATRFANIDPPMSNG